MTGGQVGLKLIVKCFEHIPCVFSVRAHFFLLGNSENLLASR